MTLSETRSKYLEFFKSKGHTIIPSASLVPQNDPTTLFTGSGMQPLVPYLLGKDHPEGKRLADSQKCFRSMDIEEVGDNRHTTFFEMLGNWSLGDYFKREQLGYFFEFLTGEIKIPKERLWVTCFEGDEKLHLPKDTESAEIWRDLGIEESQIRFYDSKKNWWSRAGTPAQMPAGEPGGPDSEVFYDFGAELKLHENSLYKNEECHPNCDCGRFLEIGNSVFMQYIKNADGTFGPLPKQNVDFGGGLERIAAVSENKQDVFLTAHKEIIEHLEKASGQTYANNTRAFRIVADHIKSAVFLITDGVKPANTEQGYFVRRLIRRAVRYSDMLGIKSDVFATLIQPVADMYRDTYPEIGERAAETQKMIVEEEARFRRTLERGLKEFTRFAQGGAITAEDAYQLVTTYGFPFELILEEAGGKGIKQVDTEGFKELLKEHQHLSRAGSKQKFKGGLADTAQQTVRLHTAHHLLLKALQMVLGPEVHQRGSNISQERLRIDFSYGQKMTKEQIAEVEKIVNEKILEDIPVVRTEMPKEEAEKLGAEHEFGAKYPEQVSVYSIGPLNGAFSIEFCGGPHVERTGQIGESGKKFKIQKEEAVAQGIRRIKGVLV